MKKAAQEEKPKEGLLRNARNTKHSELKTDLPLSEKDEVKQAEEKMRKPKKKLL